ncbi:YibE/F family protein [Mycobacterium sp. MYCO198283]|uniref:YibE/F family protein n=1 Tax=Mycobacterium sp. MYCO198283 TaxID=2883505 RepID=UPI001E4E0E90|nr:YibE/F family protein [Mycobacterium sp. MYCO198283]MCG5432105.1 YibE/F family protein [Mycobacterium sp. MYCO198283]
MTHSHPHSHALRGEPSPLTPLAARIVVGALAAIALVVVIGAALLWPSQQQVEIPLPFQNASGGAVTTEAGRVLSTTLASCGSPSAGQVLTADPVPASSGGLDCSQALIRIESGPNDRANTMLEFSPGPGQPNLVAGERIRLSRQVDARGATTYTFYDYSRGWPLLLLAAAFAIVVVLVARMRGLLAMVGIVIAFLVLVMFLLPALRDGAPPVPVALVASAAILYAVIYLAHGVSLRTSAALLGTLVSLLLAAVLSWGAIKLANITGLSEEQSTEVSTYLGNVSVTGLLLAGFIIGSLGVLNDVTVTQSSAVFELARLSTGATRQDVFVGAMRVGRDHIASTVYTLVLAYAGTSLPLLLLFSVANRSLSDVLTSESVAIEIARSAVGGIALALSVPLTTAIAALLATPGAPLMSDPAVRAGSPRNPISVARLRERLAGRRR